MPIATNEDQQPVAIIDPPLSTSSAPAAGSTEIGTPALDENQGALSSDTLPRQPTINQTAIGGTTVLTEPPPGATFTTPSSSTMNEEASHENIAAPPTNLASRMTHFNTESLLLVKNIKREPRSRPRDIRRMGDFKYTQLANQGGSWSDRANEADKTQAAMERRQRPRRNRRYKGPRPSQVVPSEQRATTQTAPRDDPMYDGSAVGSHPMQNVYQHNLDLSGFGTLCRQTYEAMLSQDFRLPHQMPYCLFLHVMVQSLNAYIIHYIRFRNGEDRFSSEANPVELLDLKSLLIPGPIYEFIASISDSITPQGDRVIPNFPDAIVPQLEIHKELTPEKPATATTPLVPAVLATLPPGTFGEPNAENHNSYEAYWSPYVTKRLIERTIEASFIHNYGAWTIFPENFNPGQATFNLNGYLYPEQLAPEGIAVLRRCRFLQEGGMAGRICLSPEGVSIVYNVLNTRAHQFKMHRGLPDPKVGQSLFIYVELENTCSDSDRLEERVATLYSFCAFGSQSANHCALFAMKRNRTSHARGLCYLNTAGNALAKWSAHINDLFEMEGPFAPTKGIDDPGLRSPKFIETLGAGYRNTEILCWITRHFFIDVRVPR